MSDAPSLFKLEDYEQQELSFSRLSLFTQCRFRYKAKYIDKKLRQDQKPTFYLSVGRSIHLALADLFKPGITSILNDVNIELAISKRWISEGYSSIEEERKWFALSIDMLQRYITSHAPANPILTEVTFKKPHDQYLIISRLDRVDKFGSNSCQIIDYKVGNRDEDPTDELGGLQWAFHYYASSETLFRLHGLSIDSIIYSYLQSGIDISIKPEEHKLKEALSDILHLAEKIDKEHEFPPHINKYCSDCQFDIICPIMRNLRI